MKRLSMIFIICIFAFAGCDAVYASHHIRTTDTADICSTITGTVRNVSESTKRRVYIRDGVFGGNHTGICSGVDGCEVDHRISLELGGSNDPYNLMIQPYDGPCNAHRKDHLENKLHALVCSNIITIQEAQRVIYDDWQSAYAKYIDPSGCE
ncbi:MAG: hypothetical protein ACXV8O_01485 [Methylobacter sp.]